MLGRRDLRRLPALSERRPVGAPAQAAQGLPNTTAADASSAARTSLATSTTPTTWWRSSCACRSRTASTSSASSTPSTTCATSKRPSWATKKYGGICEVAMSYTVSPVHTRGLLCKTRAADRGTWRGHHLHQGHGQPASAYKAYSLVKRLKESVKIPIHLHTHNTSGTGDMTLLKAIEAGVDIVDTALSPLGNGTSQPANRALGRHPAGHGVRIPASTSASCPRRRCISARLPIN